MTITVPAECTIAELATTLAEHRQWLPIDVGWPERTTVAELIGRNLSGPLRASQGTVRDYLIGLTWTAADGARVSSGGRVVKNVAGYDLAKMHVGAGGTLGTLVEATFKVRPLPEREIALGFACASAREGAEQALDVRDLVEPAWCVVTSGGADPRMEVVVGLMGGAAAVRGHATALERRWPVVRDEDGAGRRTQYVRQAAPPSGRLVRVGLLPTDVPDCMALIDAGPACEFVANPACGVVEIVVRDDDAADVLLSSLRVLAEERRGSVTDGPWSSAHSRPVRAAHDPAARLDDALRRAFGTAS